MLADSSTPSRAGIRTSQSTATSWLGSLAVRGSGSVTSGSLGPPCEVPTGQPVPCDDAAMDGRFARNSRRVAYENPWITVWHDEVTRPDGNPGIYGVVHFANLAVGVVAIDDDDRIVLVGQHRYPLEHESWEIPEGGVALDEDPVVGAQRELREETGLAAATWRELCRLEMSNSVTDETAVLFVATGLTPRRVRS